MLRFLFYLTLISFFGCSGIPRKTTSQKELRGVWMTNIDSDVMFSKENIRIAMKKLKDKGFNVVYPVVWNDGYTMFPSQVMVKYFGETYKMDPEFSQKGYDPLQEIITEGHKNGLKVIPWFEFGFSSAYEKNDHILPKYPHWAGKDQEGEILKKNGFIWMNGIHPEVQDFILALIQEVLDKYKVDGIQGDDRLPAMPSTGGYDDYTVALYKKEHDGKTPPMNYKDAAWLQWRADKLSDFGGRLYRMVKAKDQNLIVSLAPSIFPWSHEEYLQDWVTWLKRGQVDELIPQVYRYDINAYKRTLDEMAKYAAENNPKNAFIASGILIKAGPRFNNWAYIKEAIQHNRSKGINGESYFFYEGLWEKNGNLADSIYATFYKKDVQYHNKK